MNQTPNSVPRVALMLYGVLNTHNEIHAPDSAIQSLQHLLLEMAACHCIELEVFVHTEDKCFFKWAPPEKVHQESIRGFPRIADIEDRYLVCQYDANRIREDLSRIYGKYLREVHIDENAFHLAQWASANENYTTRETKNKWRNTMITTFLRRKKLIFDMVNASVSPGPKFDAYVLARPDSRIAVHVERDREKTLEELARVIRSCRTTATPLVVYQLSNCHPASFRASPEMAMLANDFIIGNHEGMKIKTSLIDYIDTQFAGNFFEAYSENIYRCSKCFYYFRSASRITKCDACLSPDVLLISEWPEYKMYQHLYTNQATMVPASFRCNVVR
jgi:hypothetical protein